MAREERDEPTTAGSLTPEAALSLMGNEIRAQILWELGDARLEERSPPALSFSELHSRVDADIDTSRFNYHLQKLVGTFVERRDVEDSQLVGSMGPDREDGYALRPEGTTLTRLIRGWTFTGPRSLDAFEIDLDCYHCGTAVEATYDNWLFALQCPDCEYLYDYNLVPPGVVDDDEATVLARVAEYNRHVRLAFARGVCAMCASGLDAEFRDPAAMGYPRGDRRAAFVKRTCDHCGHTDNLTVGEVALRDADLVSFCRERGLDVTTAPIWELEFAATDRHTTVHSTDPWEVAVEVERDDDALELVFDEDLTVVERNYS